MKYQIGDTIEIIKPFTVGVKLVEIGSLHKITATYNSSTWPISISVYGINQIPVCMDEFRLYNPYEMFEVSPGSLVS